MPEAMIGTVRSGDFQPLLNRAGELRTASEQTIPVEIVDVQENPKGLPKLAKPGRRVPFSVVMTAPLDPSLFSERCTFRAEGVTLEDVFVNRIVSLDGEADRAWYQIVFG